MPYCPYCGKELSGEEQFCPNCGATISSTMAVKPSATTVTPPSPSLISGRGIVLANWGERFIAWLIDVLIIGVVSELLRLPGLSISMIPFTAFGYRDFILFLYWMLMEGTTGQSIGKMAMRLKVTRIDGSPANLAEAAIGSVGKAFLLPLDCIIGWIAESCKENRQRLFTMLAKTIVIKVTR